MLLAAGASANATTNLGEGPLHVARQGMAAAEGSVAPYLEAIEILTAHGARSRVPFPFPRESLPGKARTRPAQPAPSDSSPASTASSASLSFSRGRARIPMALRSTSNPSAFACPMRP